MAGKILLVDDDTSVLEILAEVLEGSGYEVVTAASGYEAIDRIRDNVFDLVISDIRMAGIDGLDTLATLRQNQPDLKSIIITGYASTDDPIRAIKLKVDDYIRKPFDTKEFLASVRRSIDEFRSQAQRREELKKYREDFINTVKQIAIALENRDPYLAGHSTGVVNYSLKLGRLFGLSREKLQILEIAAYLHDLGQVEVRQAVLQKHGSLSIEEYDQVKRHPTFAGELLQAIPGFQEVIDVILHHHEKFDGTGYPRGLRGEEIPMESRILALSESFVSLLEDRPHRKGRVAEEALEILREDSGKAFDSGLIELLEKCVSQEESEEAADLQDVKEEDLSQEKKRKMLLGLGHMYRQLGQFSVARQAYEECIQPGEESADSLSVEALCGLATMAMAGGDRPAARECLDRAEKMAQKTSKLQHARVVLISGRMSLQEDKPEEALGRFARAREVFRLLEAAPDLILSLLYTLMTWLDSPPAGKTAFAEVLGETVELIKRHEFYDVVAMEAKVAVPVLVEGCTIEAADGDCGKILLAVARKFPAALVRGIRTDDEKTAAAFVHIISQLEQEEQKELFPLLRDSSWAALKEKTLPLLKEAATEQRKVSGKAYCLGNFQLCVGDTLIDEKTWKTRKSKYLMAFILSHWQDRISEEKVFEIFWGDVPTQKARRSLHTALCQARQVVESHFGVEVPDLISHEKEFYSLNPDANIWIDVKEFSESLAKGMRDIHEGRLADGIALLQKAEGLYQGDFLEGYLADWSLEYRNSLKVKYQDLLMTLIKHFYDSQRYEASVEYAKKLIEIDNCQEKAYYYQIKAFMGMGNKVEAMRTYQRCVDVMKSELGITPSVEIESLRIALKE